MAVQFASLVRGVGGMGLMTGEVVKGTFTTKFQLREFLEQAWFITSVTMMPAVLVSIPVGAVISLQVGNLAGQLGAQSFAGATAVLAVAPAKDCAPSWPARLPTWSEMTAPNGIETKTAGIIVTLVMNHACSRNSRTWNFVVKVPLTTLPVISPIPPTPRTSEANCIAILHLPGRLVTRLTCKPVVEHVSVPRATTHVGTRVDTVGGISSQRSTRQ